MFPSDDSPDRVIATPAAAAQLTALAAQRGDLTVLLSDHAAQVLPQGQGVPAGAVRLGRLNGAIAFAARTDERTDWWCKRAVIDLRDRDSNPDPALTVALAPLNEDELYAAIAGGPLPRY